MLRAIANLLLSTVVMLLISARAKCQLPERYDPPKLPSRMDNTCCVQRLAQNLADQLQDWAQLARYHDNNIELMQQPSDPQRVVFIGDSVIASWKLSEYFLAKPYVNRGIGGQTTQQELLRLFEDVIDLKPAAAVIEGGLNDIQHVTGPETLTMVEENLQAMTELAQAHNIKVILCTTTPVSELSKTKWTAGPIPPDDIVKLNAWIRLYAARAHTGLADSYAALAGSDGLVRQEYSDDGVHPNSKGYKVMAPVVENAIEKSIH